MNRRAFGAALALLAARAATRKSLPAKLSTNLYLGSNVTRYTRGMNVGPHAGRLIVTHVDYKKGWITVTAS